jgi:hypothetical protein
MKYEAFRLKFSLKPIHWYKKSNVTGSSPPKGFHKKLSSRVQPTSWTWAYPQVHFWTHGW